MHRIVADVAETGTPPWLLEFIDAGLLAFERRLDAEWIMDEIDARPGPRMRPSDRREPDTRERVPSAG